VEGKREKGIGKWRGRLHHGFWGMDAPVEPNDWFLFIAHGTTLKVILG